MSYLLCKLFLPFCSNLIKMHRKALFSPCQKYRYALWREWDTGSGQVLFVGLNPSVANEQKDDPTIRRCMGFAQSWGYRRLCVVNLYAYRDKSPKVLFQQKDPIGPENDQYLQQFISDSERIIVAWGNHALRSDRYLAVLKLIAKPWCLQINKSGQPAHPLYLKHDIQVKPYHYDPPHLQ